MGEECERCADGASIKFFDSTENNRMDKFTNVKSFTSVRVEQLCGWLCRNTGSGDW